MSTHKTSRGRLVPILLGALLAAFLVQPAMAQNAARKPNFIIIFADDLGYQDLSCYGSPTISTPRLDRMAEEGMKFTDFHSCSPVCSPSRAALLTGSYPARVGLASGVLFPNARIGLSHDEITLAELLRDQGYATACIGKWHLGDAPQFLPTENGFDYYYGIPYSNDMRITRDGKSGPPLLRDAETIEHPVDQRTITERYTDEAIRFITANRQRPFLLYLPHTMPHVPLFVSERFADQSRGGLYGDVVETIDWSTGEILDTLKRLGLDENTLVIFTSDNGPWLIKKEHGGAALPLRDGKGTVYEGGMRVPCIMRWPGKVPAGRVCDELGTMMDFLPTFAALAGARLPGDRVIDGKNILPLLLGKAGAQSPYDAFFHYSSPGALAAVRSGPWKLHLPKTVRREGQDVRMGAELYNLSADIGERDNVAAEHPDLVDRLTRLAEEHRAELAQNSRPVGRLSDAALPPDRGDIPDRGANDSP